MVTISIFETYPQGHGKYSLTEEGKKLAAKLYETKDGPLQQEHVTANLPINSSQSTTTTTTPSLSSSKSSSSIGMPSKSLSSIPQPVTTTTTTTTSSTTSVATSKTTSSVPIPAKSTTKASSQPPSRENSATFPTVSNGKTEISESSHSILERKYSSSDIFQITLILDQRESINPTRDLYGGLTARKIPVELRTLSVGDMMWIAKRYSFLAPSYDLLD